MNKLTFLSAAALLAASGVAQAAPLVVLNQSFEAGVGTASFPPPANFTTDGTPAGPNGGFTEGFNQIGNPTGGDLLRYAGIDNGTLAQDLNVPFLPNTVYTVRFLVGDRSGGPAEGTTQYGLKASGDFATDLGTPVSVDNESLPDGTFSEGPAYTFTTGTLVPVGNVVVFFRGLDDGSGNRAIVDLARVDASPVPEPAAATALVAAAAGALTRRRRNG